MSLLPFEQKMFDEPTLHRSTPLGDDAVNERYARGEVRIVTEQARYPLTAIPGMVDGDDYELNPEFQRRHRWDDVRKSRLIESFIMNVPIPPIFLYEARYSFYEVMDGLQRLSAIRDFYRDEYALEGLQEWSDLNGKRYSQLPQEVRRGVDRRYLSSIILLHETAKTKEEAQRLKQLVFERINSGGERLTPQESRNAVFPGPLNDLCIELSHDENLRALWHIPDLSSKAAKDSVSKDEERLIGISLYKTMGDVELVLRFFAYRQQLEKQERLTLRDYLDVYLRKGNLLPADELVRMGQIFQETVLLVRQIFGSYSLSMYKESHGKWRYTGRPTLTVYDPLMWSASNFLYKADELRARSALIRAELKKFYTRESQYFSGRTADRRDIEKRNSLFLGFFEHVLSLPINGGEDDSCVDHGDMGRDSVDFEEVMADSLAREVEESENGGPGE